MESLTACGPACSAFPCTFNKQTPYLYILCGPSKPSFLNLRPHLETLTYTFGSCETKASSSSHHFSGSETCNLGILGNSIVEYDDLLWFI